LSGSTSPPAVYLARASGDSWRRLEVLVAVCLRLEAVDLSHCVSVGDLEAVVLAVAAGLRELRLDKCLDVTDKCWFMVVPCFTNRFVCAMSMHGTNMVKSKGTSFRIGFVSHFSHSAQAPLQRTGAW
jgi:hypothetical protein